jgi:hypothetical protein
MSEIVNSASGVRGVMGPKLKLICKTEASSGDLNLILRHASGIRNPHNIPIRDQ